MVVFLNQTPEDNLLSGYIKEEMDSWKLQHLVGIHYFQTRYLFGEAIKIGHEALDRFEADTKTYEMKECSRPIVTHDFDTIYVLLDKSNINRVKLLKDILNLFDKINVKEQVRKTYTELYVKHKILENTKK